MRSSSPLALYDMDPSLASYKGDAGSEEKFESTRRKEIGESSAAAEVVVADDRNATEVAVAKVRANFAGVLPDPVPTPMAASSASVKGATSRIEEHVPMSPAGGGSLLALVLVLTAVLAVAVPTGLFHIHPMSQVWILSVSICSCVFLCLLFIRRSWRFYPDLVRLSHGPLLASSSASVIGSANVTLVLLFSMIWAAGNLGYSFAVHHLSKGTEPAIHTLPRPSCPTNEMLKHLNFDLYIGAPILVLLWTSIIAIFINVIPAPDELELLTFLSYFGWIHLACWLLIVAVVPMQGSPLDNMIEWLMRALLTWMLFSPAICLVSQILSVLCHLLLTMALAAFVWYNLAIYIHFLATATPSTTTQENEDTLHSKIEHKIIGQVKCDPRLGETSSEAAATLGLPSRTTRSNILEDEIWDGGFDPSVQREDHDRSQIVQLNSDARLGETLSIAAATLVPSSTRLNEDTLRVQGKIQEDKIGQVNSREIYSPFERNDQDRYMGLIPDEAAATLMLSR